MISNKKFFIVICLSLIISIGFVPKNIEAEDNHVISVVTASDIEQSLNKAKSGDVFVFEFLNSIELKNDIVISKGVKVTFINTKDQDVVITREKDLIPVDALVKVDGELILEQNISGSLTFDGEDYDYKDGSMFYVEGIMNVKFATIRGAKASNGGAISGIPDSHIIIDDGNFYANTATQYGGVIYTKGSLSILGGTFSNNLGTEGAGCIFYSDPTGNESLNITGGLFKNNKTGAFGMFGGALYIDAGSASIIGGSFTGNTSFMLGGAIYIQDGATVSMQSVLVNDNVAAAQGGGIFNCNTGGGNFQHYQGLTLYNNVANPTFAYASGDDFYSETKTTNQESRSIYLSDYILSGKQSGYYLDARGDRYKPSNTLMPSTYYQNSSSLIELKSAVQQEDYEASKNLAKVSIYNNSSYSGGGIANNGILNIGYNTVLNIKKTVQGNNINKNDVFTFTVKLENENGIPFDGKVTMEYNGTNSSLFFNNGVATIQLKSDEEVYLYGAPDGLIYSVEEQFMDGYTISNSFGTTGVITSEKECIASFTNTKVGNLSVSKKVTGEMGDRNKEFPFKVVLNDTTFNRTCGEMIFKDGVATFTLKHGETILATGIPEGIEYIVIESENEDYIVNEKNDKGVIEAEKTISVEFANHRDTNIIEKDAATLDLNIFKRVDNETPNSNEFEFYLLDNEKTILQKKHNNKGDIKFDRLYFKQSGEFNFYIKEKVGTNNSIIYDNSVYMVQVIIREKGEGVFALESVQYFKNGELYNEIPTFVNTTKKQDSIKTPDTKDYSYKDCYLLLFVFSFCFICLFKKNNLTIKR